MEEIKLKDFISDCMRLTTHECRACGNLVELVFEPYCIKIEGKYIEIDRFPKVKCITCGATRLTEKSKKVVLYLHDELIKRKQETVISTHRHLGIKYDFCEKIEFHYDYEDYQNIPGLTALTGDGFLTPVFFNKNSLIYFMHHPEYELSLFSESYGTLRYMDHFEIPFGINSNGKVVMWLGDLDKLNQETLDYLKIHNIESDHTLINSEFYLGQMCSIFSEPIIERQIINLRNKLYDNLKIRNELNLNHLDEEVIAVLDDIRKPIVYSPLEIKPVISALHKILIESVSLENFKSFYRNTIEPMDKDYIKWGSIKYYEFLLLFLSGKNKVDDEVKRLIAPLYLLNDLRILYFHLLPTEKQESLKQNIVTTLELEAFQDTEQMYSKLVSRLYDLFEYLASNS